MYYRRMTVFAQPGAEISTREAYVHKSSRRVMCADRTGGSGARRLPLPHQYGDDGDGAAVNHQHQWPEPTPRADPDLRRERTGLYLRGRAGPLEGEMEVNADSPGSSATATAVNLLLATAAAAMAGGSITGIFWVAHVSGLPLAFAGLGIFAAVFAITTILISRRADRAAETPPPVVIIQDPRRRAAPLHGNGDAPLKLEADQQPALPNGKTPRRKHKTR